MNRPTNPLPTLLRRWSNQQQAALHKLSNGKGAGQRLGGFNKSKRTDAKFLLLAIMPFIPLIVSDTLGWERGVLWYGWFWISAACAFMILSICLIAYWRALRRSIRSRHE
jgi:hypothetical protein